MVKKLIVAVLLILVIANLSYRIDLYRSPHELIGELMYFPSGFAIHALSMGFYNVFADLIWLRFIQYYGEHRMTDARFELMYHILDILTTLDPKFAYAYTLGGLMLTHDAEAPEQAKKLLKKGMKENPDDWRYPYMYAFIHYIFIKNLFIAKTYFTLAAKKPTATDMAKRWAAFVTYYKLGELEPALKLWYDLYNNTENPEEKAIAEYYIKKIKMKIDIEFLNDKIKIFEEKTGRKPYRLKELILYNIIDSLPSEPHNEKYILKKGWAHSTWQDKFGR